MTHKSNASCEKLSCTNFVNFGSCHDLFVKFSWSKVTPISGTSNSKYSRICENVFGWYKNLQREKRISTSLQDYEISHLLQLRTLAERKHVTNQMPTMSIGLIEQLKLAHKIVDVVQRENCSDKAAVQCGQPRNIIYSSLNFSSKNV